MKGTVVVVAMVVIVGGRESVRRWAGRSTRRRLHLLGPPSARRRRAAPIERWVAPRLHAADVVWPAEVVVWAAAIAVVVGAVLGVLAGGPVLGLAGALAIGGGLLAALQAARGRRDARIQRELPALLEAVARSLRSGAAIPVALGEAAATGSAAAADLASVLEEVDRGLPLAEALDRWVIRRPRGGTRLVVGALAVALSSGGGAARAVDGVASTLRERSEVEGEVRSLATQARASAVVVILAPLAFAALGALGDERTATFLLRTPPGLACLVTGLALDGVGAWWMARIVGSSA